jgi:hypothetical protein
MKCLLKKMNTIKKLRVLCVLLTTTLLTGIIAGFMVTAAPEDTVDFNTYPIPEMDNTEFGYRIAKTMHLLETSTAAKPNTVKIAVTGQSISDGGNSWAPDLIHWLKQKYPTANIIYRNFAIGGFATQLLHKRVPNDMASFYPDLVICYVYGDHTLYDKLVKNIRETTSAEIMLQTCHYVNNGDWDNTYSYELMPEIANKYHAELCQIRPAWRAFLLDHDIPPSRLLNDGVHLNASGQTLMLGLMKQFFVYRPGNAQEVIDGQYIRVRNTDWHDGVLSVPFEGNRVEIIAGTGSQHPVNVLIDDRKPSEIKESFIRSDESRGMFDTNIGIVNYNSPPGEQTWTIEVISGTNKNNFEYTATGSKTGLEGTSSERVLNGKHLKLDSDSFILAFKGDHDVVPADGRGNFKITFNSVLNGTDVYNGSKALLASGLESRNHTLKLTAQNQGQIPDIMSIKVSDPGILAKTDVTPPTYSKVVIIEPARTDWIDNGNFEGPFTVNMYGQGVDIPDGWGSWGVSSMTVVRGEGVGGSAGGQIKPNTGSASNVKILVSEAGKNLLLSFDIKQKAAAQTGGVLTCKIHAKSDEHITVNGSSQQQNYERTGEGRVYVNNDTFIGVKEGEFVKVEKLLRVPALNEIVNQNGVSFEPQYFILEFWNNDNGGTYIIDNISLKSPDGE